MDPSNLPANTVVGRLGVGVGPGEAIPFTVLASAVGAVAGPVGPVGPVGPAGPVGPTGPAVSAQLFDSRTAATAATIPGTVNFVRTSGYAAIGDYGGTLYKHASGTTTGGFQSADGQWWQIAETAVVRPEMFGAKGDNSTDDTTAIQNAITVAQAVPKGIIDFRTATYKATSALNFTSGFYLRGSGYNTSYKATSGTQIAFYGNITGLSIVTDDSFFIEKIGFYANTPGNCTLVSINTDNSASTNCSTCSVIRDCFFQGANIGLQATSIGLFIFDNNQFWNCTTNSLLADITTPGGGDCILTNSTFSGGPSQGHFRTGTIGGMRIVNNKFNCSGGIAAIVFAGTAVSAAAMSPLIIANNSIEGALQGISFLRTGSATISCNNFAITGNEIACTGNNAIAIVCTQGGGNTNQWLSGGSISGNLITVNNGTSLSCINLNAAADINIAANMFTSNVAATPAVTTGGNVARITTGSNGKGANVT